MLMDRNLLRQPSVNYLWSYKIDRWYADDRLELAQSHSQNHYVDLGYRHISEAVKTWPRILERGLHESRGEEHRPAYRLGKR